MIPASILPYGALFRFRPMHFLGGINSTFKPDAEKKREEGEDKISI